MKNIESFLIMSLTIVLLFSVMIGVSSGDGCPEEVSIGDFVWADLDVDGIWDTGELGIPDVIVNLYNGNDIFIGATTTNETGNYIFAYVSPGDYYVEFILPEGYVFSPQDQGSDDANDSDANVITGKTIITTLSVDEDDMTWDAGMYRPEVDIVKEVWNEDNLEWENSARVSIWAQVKFRITVSNIGESVLHNLVITDEMALQLEYESQVNYTPSSESPHQVIWTFSELNLAEHIEIIYYAKAVHVCQGWNKANVTTDESVSDESTVLVKVLDMDTNIPIIQLYYPTGGETLSGTVSIDWFAADSNHQGESLPIYIFYKASSDDTWTRINDDALPNTGQYDWDVGSLSDGGYILLIEAVNSCKGVAHETSDPFMVDNSHAMSNITEISIIDATINSSQWVKNGDTVEIIVKMTETLGLSMDEIKANLTSFGCGANVSPDSFDGYTARWILTDVQCVTPNGAIAINVKVGDIDEVSATISADNTKPELTIDKPEGGFYMFNRKIIPLEKSIILGAFTFEFNVNDNGGIEKTEIYINEELKTTLPEGSFEWYMNMGISGKHSLKFVTYDYAGNKDTVSTMITMFNLFGA